MLTTFHHEWVQQQVKQKGAPSVNPSDSSILKSFFLNLYLLGFCKTGNVCQVLEIVSNDSSCLLLIQWRTGGWS
jgi:hypothetical protein